MVVYLSVWKEKAWSFICLLGRDSSSRLPVLEKERMIVHLFVKEWKAAVAVVCSEREAKVIAF